jgi:hypothetical protein
MGLLIVPKISSNIWPIRVATIAISSLHQNKLTFDGFRRYRFEELITDPLFGASSTLLIIFDKAGS